MTPEQNRALYEKNKHKLKGKLGFYNNSILFEENDELIIYKNIKYLRIVTFNALTYHIEYDYIAATFLLIEGEHIYYSTKML